MAITKLGIYNNALHLLGERRLSNLYEDREPRHVLDQNYNLALVNQCLEIAMPRFAVKTVKLATPTTSSEHGIDEVYSFPADFVSLLRDPGTHGNIGCFFADEDLSQPVNRYILEGNTVACEVATNLYMRYLTDSIQPSGFTPSFARLISAQLARASASRINPSRIQLLDQAYKEALAEVIAIESIKENDFIVQKAAASLSTDQLAVYNVAAAALAKPEIRYIDDESALRLAIDAIYETSTNFLLEEVSPRFATRVVELSGGAPSAVHAYDNVFGLPADFKQLVGLWSDASLDEQIHRYFIEDDDIAIENHTTAYLRYISTATVEAEWAPGFVKALGFYIASQLAPRFAPDEASRANKRYEDALQVSIAADAVKESPRPTAGTRTITTAERGLYNTALELVDLDPIISNDDESDRKVKLDYALDHGAVLTLLGNISWGFARASAKLEEDDTVVPAWGLAKAFAVPSDMVRINSVSADEYFRFPTEYYREGDYFFADADPLYITYVSDNLVSAVSSWPRYFYNLVAAELAKKLGTIPGANISKAVAKYEEYKREAYNTDAQRNPPQVISTGRWNRSRDTWQRRRHERP